MKMMELALLSPLIQGIKLLVAVAEQAHQNKSECKRLSAHAQAVVRLIWREHARGVPEIAGRHLLKMARCALQVLSSCYHRR